MSKIEYNILQTGDTKSFELIANWYLNEWNIPFDKTIQRLNEITTDPSQFQVLMTFNEIPISTGGVYSHVGLLDKEPRFKVHKNWLALVYTLPEQRHKGYGTLLCKFIQQHTKNIGLNDLYLFTDTAERLYQRLGWSKTESLQLGPRNIVVMNIKLTNNLSSG